MRIAVYGKGGIGKSTITSNLSYSLSRMDHKVIQIGCDPKCDSTRPLLKGRYQTTVTEYMRDVPPSKRRMEDIVSEGSNGILCIEAGGPSPGTGCAGKGIISMFSTLEKMGLDGMGYDYTLYDVLGDVVCGGFSIPMRPEHSDAILIVTSGEYMSLFAANNIMKGSRQFEKEGGRVAGLILNRRGLENEDSLVEAFSDATGVPILGRIDRSEIFRAASAKGCTVCEYDDTSPEAKCFSDMVETICALDLSELASPAPLTDMELDRLYSEGRFDGHGSFLDKRAPKTYPDSIPVFTAPRRIGKGPVAAVLEAGKVTDIPVVIHGTSSCGFTMLNEVTEERIRHLVSDPEAFVSPGDNMLSTDMTADSSIFGGQDRLRAKLEPLVKGNKAVLVISTCLPGMIGDDCERLIEDMQKENPGSRILFVDANRVDSGFDAHMEVIRALAGLIDTGIEPQGAFINVVDDNFISFNKGENRRNLEILLSDVGMVSGPGFLNDCSVDEIIGLRRYGISVLAEDGRDNNALKGILLDKGIRFMEHPLPRGYAETVDWMKELVSISGIDADPSVGISEEYRQTLSRYSPDLIDKRVVILSWEPKKDLWMADALEDCGCEAAIYTVPGNGIPDERVEEKGSKDDILKALSSADAVIDGMGIAGKDSLPQPETWLSHKASMELIRRVWGYLRSSGRESWNTWRD